MFGNIYNKETPGQLYHIGSHGLTCELAEPDDALKHHIHYYWLMQVGDQSVDLEVIPDAATDLVMSPELPSFSGVYLPTTEKFTIPLNGPIHYAGICFHSETAPALLRASVEQIRTLDLGVETTKKLGLGSLIESILGITDIEQLRNLFDTFFRHRLDKNALTVRPAILRNLVDNLEPTSISEIASRVGVSERQFRRTATNLTGLSPKQLQRILRLQTSLHAMFDQYSGPDTDNFYDDSHKIKEIKKLTGLTPGQIKKLAEKYNLSE
ncbi:MAG: AraC family transcriptional regulator [Gammaproteobacteria bacterium]|nr:AraC family transcriptional regulator [Gammaproteobacteria bacterium]